MSGVSKFSHERPKGNAWGIEDAVAEATKEFMKTGHSPMIPIVGVLGIKTVEVGGGEDGLTYTPVVSIRRINSLDDPESIKLAQRLIVKAIQNMEGPKGVEQLPMDEASVIMGAFGGVDTEELAVDDAQLAEDSTLNDLDRLRRHMVSVHLREQAEIDGLEVTDVKVLHQSDHDLGRRVMIPHDPEWWEWRRIVVAERVAELHSEGVTWGAEAEEPMDDLEELTAHMSVVHDFADEALADLTLSEMRAKHVADHEDPPDDPFPVHEVAFLGTHPLGADLDAVATTAEDDQTAADGEPADSQSSAADEQE